MIPETHLGGGDNNKLIILLGDDTGRVCLQVEVLLASDLRL